MGSCAFLGPPPVGVPGRACGAHPPDQNSSGPVPHRQGRATVPIPLAETEQVSALGAARHQHAPLRAGSMRCAAGGVVFTQRLMRSTRLLLLGIERRVEGQRACLCGVLAALDPRQTIRCPTVAAQPP